MRRTPAKASDVRPHREGGARHGATSTCPGRTSLPQAKSRRRSNPPSSPLPLPARFGRATVAGGAARLGEQATGRRGTPPPLSCFPPVARRTRVHGVARCTMMFRTPRRPSLQKGFNASLSCHRLNKTHVAGKAASAGKPGLSIVAFRVGRVAAFRPSGNTAPKTRLERLQSKPSACTAQVRWLD